MISKAIFWGRSRCIYWSVLTRSYSGLTHNLREINPTIARFQINTEQFRLNQNSYVLPQETTFKQSHWSNQSNTIGLIGASLSAGFVSYSNNDEPPEDIKSMFETLSEAVRDGDEAKVKRLVKKCSPQDLNYRHEMGWKLIHVAAINGRSRICEILIKNGARVNDTDNYSSPTLVARKLNIDPLLVAITRDEEFFPELTRGINYKGCTALHYATMSNDPDTVKVITKYRGNPFIKNDQGLTAANFSKNQSIIRTLKQHEKDYVEQEKKLDEEERRKYPLEMRVKEHIVGQDAAISMVAATIRRKETGWFDEDHPLVFLFLGSSGVGKTELAKQVARYLNKEDKNAFVRLDMSEYQERHAVARMIGSPPGYVGHQDGGQLTEALKKCSNAVVLFDEVEKAHPKVLTVLLQLFDEGRLTDGKGNTIECKNAIFIMTSNLASEAIAQHALRLREEQQLRRELMIQTSLDGSKENLAEDYQEQVTISRKFKDNIVRPVLKAHLQRDEFLGRINEMVYFLPFSESELKQLVQKELEAWASTADKIGVKLTWDLDVIDLMSSEYDVHYGARSIKHAVERRIVNEVSELHYNNKNAKNIHISTQGGDTGSSRLIRIKAS